MRIKEIPKGLCRAGRKETNERGNKNGGKRRRDDKRAVANNEGKKMADGV